MPHPVSVALPHSGIREIMDMVMAMPTPVVRMEIGEPDFATPAHVVEEAFQAARRGTGYVQTPGMPVLREALRTNLARKFGADIPTGRILVTHGAVEGIQAIMTTVVGAGDEVLVPDPAWPNYEMQSLLLGATPVAYRLDPATGFLPDPAEIAALITARTRAIVLNSPSNPTGAVIPREILQQIVDVAVAHDILVISDEVYDEIIFEGEHTFLAALAPEHVASVFSFSKTYAMTGWRVGYAVVPAALADPVTRVLEASISCLSSVTQAAALSAVQGPQEVVAEMRETYRARRDLAVRILAEAGIPVTPPAGAFYLMIPCAPGITAREAALELVDEGLALAPGSAFGANGSEHLRVSLATSEDDIRRGLECYVRWYRTRVERIGA